MTDINRYYPHPPPTTPPHHDPHGPNSPRHFIKKLTEKVDFGEDVDFVVGVTATALTADQLIKQTTCKDHKVMHLAKAGLGAAVAATAFTMMSREHNQRKHVEKKNHPHRDHYIHRARNRSFSRDSSPSPRRLLENGHHEEKEEWAVVRSRSPDPRHARSASVGATKRGDHWSRNPRYYEDDDSDRSERGFDDGPPYPDEGRYRRRDRSLSRSISPEPETRRPRAYSHGDTHRGGGGRSESPNTLKRMWKLVRDGMEYYDRYDRNRR